MKEAKVKVPFFVNKLNQEYLLDGKRYKDFDVIHNSVFTNCNGFIYKPRRDGIIEDYKGSEYSMFSKAGDQIVGKSISLEEDENQAYLNIILYDTLYFSMLKDPVIKVNGMCIIEDNIIDFVKPLRYSLDDRDRRIDIK